MYLHRNEKNTNYYLLEVGANLVLIEGFCGLADFNEAELVYKSCFESKLGLDVCEKLTVLKALIKEVIIDKTLSIAQMSNKYSDLDKSFYDAIRLFLGNKKNLFAKNNKEFLSSLISVSDEIKNRCLYTFLKYTSDFQILFLWPSTFKKKNKRKLAVADIESNLNIIDSFDLKLNKKAFYQLFYLLYFNFDWAKKALNEFSSGFVDKIYKCSGGGGQGLISIYIVDSNLETLLDFKRDKLRDYFNIGFHSAHSCDNKSEALPITELLLNKNSFRLFTCADFSKNNTLIENLVLHKVDTGFAYLENVYNNLLTGKTMFDSQISKGSLNTKKWGEIAPFYGYYLIVGKNIRNSHYNFNPYNKYFLKYKFIRCKSHIINGLKKILGR